MVHAISPDKSSREGNMNSWNAAFRRLDLDSTDLQVSSEKTMTLQGAINRTATLLGLALAAVVFSWIMYYRIGNSIALWVCLLFVTIAGAHICLFTILKKDWSPITGCLFAIVEGILVGGVSAAIDVSLPGIAGQAVLIWFAAGGAILAASKLGIVKRGQKLRSGFIATVLGIAFLFLAAFILKLFAIYLPILLLDDLIGIIIGLVVLILAAINLALDFDVVLSLADQRVPQYMEWYAAFAFVLSLTWMYIYTAWFIVSRVVSFPSH